MEISWLYKTLWETAPSVVTSFSRKKLFLTKIFEQDFETLEFNFEISNSSMLKAHNFVWQGFSSIIISQLWRPIELIFFTGLLFCA